MMCKLIACIQSGLVPEKKIESFCTSLLSYKGVILEPV